jgi:hypothetical protein
VAAYYIVQPNGTYSTQGTITDPADSNSLLISDIAIGPAGETYFGTNDSVYNSSSGKICQVPNQDGLSVDASGTLLTGTQISNSFYPNPTPTNCAPTVPVLDQLPFGRPLVDAHGDIYVESTTNGAVYKYVRTQLHGIVFASAGTATSYGSMAITNSGNMPLNLSNFQFYLSGSSPQSFNTEGTTCSQSLAPAASCAISLSYTPTGTYATLPASASLNLGGLRDQQVVPLNGFPNQ